MNKNELELKLNKEEILNLLKSIKEYGVEPFLLYTTLLNLSEDKKVCSISVDKLMRELNACKSQVYVYISKLKKIGLISTIKNNGEIIFYLNSINSIFDKTERKNESPVETPKTSEAPIINATNLKEEKPEINNTEIPKVREIGEFEEDPDDEFGGFIF